MGLEEVDDSSFICCVFLLLSDNIFGCLYTLTKLSFLWKEVILAIAITIDNGLFWFECVKPEPFKKIETQTKQNRTTKQFKLNRYKNFKLKPNRFRDFQTFEPLKPRGRGSVLVFKLGQNSNFYILILICFLEVFLKKNLNHWNRNFKPFKPIKTRFESVNPQTETELFIKTRT